MHKQCIKFEWRFSINFQSIFCPWTKRKCLRKEEEQQQQNSNEDKN